jgi:hypothetical protein
MIDMVTNLVEVIRLDNEAPAHVALCFENAWLSRCPRPMLWSVGGEFAGCAFQRTLNGLHVRCHPISAKNPQANSVCERTHQTIGHSLRALSALHRPAGTQDAPQLVDSAVANAVHATRAAVHSSLNAAPDGLAFGRAVALDTPLIADLLLIQEQRQHLIDGRLVAASWRHFSYDCNVNQARWNREPWVPFCVERVHANVTLAIHVAPHVIERILLRCVKPCRGWRQRVFVLQAKVSLWIASRQRSVLLHSATLRGRMRHWSHHDLEKPGINLSRAVHVTDADP